MSRHDSHIVDWDVKHNLRKTQLCGDTINRTQVVLKSLLRQGLSEPDFYGDLVYKLKKIVGSNNFFSAVH